MKQAITFLFLFFCVKSYSQTNTFPPNGNVGIGLLNPLQKLTIRSTGTLTGISSTDYDFGITDGAANQLQLLGLVNGAGNYGLLQVIKGGIGAGNLLMQTQGGNVGIGTTSPDTKLHVDGTIKSSVISLAEGPTLLGFFGRGLPITGAWSQTPDILSLTYMRRDFAIGGWSKSNATWKGAAFYINSDNGNVGIGTTNPDAKLSVNGLIHTQEVKVDMKGWSDFVFAKDYILPTLAETEKHIKEKGHLQGIPSTKEVKANGIELGDMNAKLLQKIEELTLHLIEQNKLIQLQQKDIEYLKSKLK